MIFALSTDIKDLFEPNNSSYNLRVKEFMLLSNTTSYGKHSMKYLGPQLWYIGYKKARFRCLNNQEMLKTVYYAHLSFCSIFFLAITVVHNTLAWDISQGGTQVY